MAPADLKDRRSRALWVGLLGLTLAAACAKTPAPSPTSPAAARAVEGSTVGAGEGGTGSGGTGDSVATEPASPPAPDGPDEAATEASSPSKGMATNADAEADDNSDQESVPRPKLDPKLEKRILAVQPIVDEKSAKHGVDPDLLNGLIWVESKFDPKAKGPAGAMGLMQLMPRTARSLAGRLDRKSRPYDPDFSVEAGALYLARLLKRFDGDERLALAAYNRGAGKVLGWVEAGTPLPERTEAYVDRVLDARSWLRVFVREKGASSTDLPIAVGMIRGGLAASLVPLSSSAIISL